MPVLSDSRRTNRSTVAASAPIELMWVLHSCEADHKLTGSMEALEPLRLELRDQLNAFWDDKVRGFPEVVVLAQRGDTLLDPNLDRFFDRLELAAAMDVPTPSLLSETSTERKAISDRLDRLRNDAGLRARYAVQLRSAWDSLGGDAAVGERAVAEAAAEWRRKLEAGVTFRDLLERAHIWPGKAELDEIADAAAVDGRLVLTPCWYGGDVHAVELDGMVYLGRGIQRRDHEEKSRHVAAHVSTQLKALADPTRVAILMSLAQEPASVTELAIRFRLSQPTISGHVQVLRDAGLLDERPSGRSLKLSTSEANLRRLFDDAQGELVKFFRL